MFLKHGLQLMNYKSLAIADIKNPIVVILPFKSSLDEEYRDDLFNESGSKAILHAEKLFGRSFSSVDDLKDFLAFAHSPQTLSAMLRAPERLLFDTDWNGPLGAQLERAMKDFSLIAGNHAGEIVFNQCFGRMSQASDIAWKSSNLGGVPLIDAPTSWQYYNWRLEYAANLDTLNQVPLHVTRGMQRLAETDMHWLGNIPPEALIEMRKVGALDEVRGILCQGVEEVISLNSENFFRSADKIYENLELAFDNHKKDIDRLRAKKWKFAGSDIGSWIVAGSIEVAAAVLGTPAWGVAATVVSQITDAPKLKDIPRAIKDLRDEGQKISHSAGGLLFKHKP